MRWLNRWVRRSSYRPDKHPTPTAQALTVEQIARASGLRVRKVALPENWWKHDHGPLVGFLSPEHCPVALLPMSASRYSLRRPGGGGDELVTDHVAGLLERDALTFYRSLPSRLATGREVLAFGLKGCRRDILSVIAMGVLGSFLGFLAPVLTAAVFDTIIPFSGRGLLVQVTIGLVAAALGAAAFELTKAFSIMRIIQRGNASIQCGVWDRLLNMPVSFFRNYTAGDLALRANSIGEISTLLKGPALLAVLSAIFTSFNLALMFYYSSRLAVTGAVLIAIALGIELLVCRSQFGAQRRVQALRGEIGGLILQVILGIGKIRTAGAETRAFTRWAMSFELDPQEKHISIATLARMCRSSPSTGFRRRIWFPAGASGGRLPPARARVAAPLSGSRAPPVARVCRRTHSFQHAISHALEGPQTTSFR